MDKPPGNMVVVNSNREKYFLFGQILWNTMTLFNFLADNIVGYRVPQAMIFTHKLAFLIAFLPVETVWKADF